MVLDPGGKEKELGVEEKEKEKELGVEEKEKERAVGEKGDVG